MKSLIFCHGCHLIYDCTTGHSQVGRSMHKYVLVLSVFVIPTLEVWPYQCDLAPSNMDKFNI